MLKSLSILLCVLSVGLFGCAESPRGVGPMPGSYMLDGNRPVVLSLSPKARQWAAKRGRVPGDTLRLFEQAMPAAQMRWNPSATGIPQPVLIEYQDEPGSTCLKQRSDGSWMYAAWTHPGYPTIYVCPSFVWGTAADSQSLDGYRGIYWLLVHELGHQFGALTHASQGNRQPNYDGPILCGWSNACVDLSLTDYTPEDVDLICQNGHGGRCKTGLPAGSEPGDMDPSGPIFEPAQPSESPAALPVRE